MKIKINLIFPGMLLASSSVVLAAEMAQPKPEVLLLRKQLEQLKAGYIRQVKAINMLEGRLRQLEESKRSIAKPSQSITKKQASPSKPPIAKTKQTSPTKKTAKEQKVVKKAPRNTSVNALLSEEHTLFGNRFTFEIGTTYSRFSRAQINLSGFLALDAIFLGRIDVSEIKSDVVTIDLTARYGITDRVQIDFNAPFLYRNSTFFKGNVGGASASGAEADVSLGPELGDINLGVFYQVIPENADWPDVVWNIRVKAPTGTEPYGIGTKTLDNGLTVPKSLPSGNGVWAISSGFSFVKTVDPAILFANLNFFHNFVTDFDNIGGNTPVPGTIDLGNAYQFGFGIAFALNERLSMNFSYTQRFTDTARQKAQGGQWQSITGSDANIATLNVGASLALTRQLTLVTNIGIGLTTDAPDVQLSFKFPYQF